MKILQKYEHCYWYHSQHNTCWYTNLPHVTVRIDVAPAAEHNIILASFLSSMLARIVSCEFEVVV